VAQAVLNDADGFQFCAHKMPCIKLIVFQSMCKKENSFSIPAKLTSSKAAA
jgi:hypothetical protein